MLPQNAYLLAKIGADTAENERNFAENLPNLATTLRVHYPTGRAQAGRGRRQPLRQRGALRARRLLGAVPRGGRDGHGRG